MQTMKLYATEHPFTVDKDISSQSFWLRSFDERDVTFSWLREHAPVSWHPPLEAPGLPADVHGEKGFWAVTRPADLQFVSQHHELFSSDIGSVQLRPQHPALGHSPNFLEMDPPRHTEYRKIMSAAFTPRAVRRLNAKINERAAQIVGNVVGAGKIEFVERVSARLPMLTIADLVGVPESLTETFARAGDNAVAAAYGDEEVLGGQDPVEFTLAQVTTLGEIGNELVAHRRQHPSDDIATALAQAELDGRPLSPDEIASVTILLSVAGNDTTKQTTSATVWSMHRWPDQRAWLAEDFDGRIGCATEEFVRHATPVMAFSRAATQDVELGGQQITAGDKIGIFYCSANRDELTYPDPSKFDLPRQPNPHVGFGGRGVHYCLGHGIAKAQLRALFREIITKLPNLEVIGEPVQLRSEFINGIAKMTVDTH
jgi:cytochrome P450